MNYGYECKGWSAEKKERLALKVAEIIEGASYVGGSTIRATVEVDEAYPGVRIRKMGWMTEKSQANVIATMDYAYEAEARR